MSTAEDAKVVINTAALNTRKLISVALSQNALDYSVDFRPFIRTIIYECLCNSPHLGLMSCQEKSDACCLELCREIKAQLISRSTINSINLSCSARLDYTSCK